MWYRRDNWHGTESIACILHVCTSTDSPVHTGQVIADWHEVRDITNRDHRRSRWLVRHGQLHQVTAWTPLWSRRREKWGASTACLAQWPQVGTVGCHVIQWATWCTLVWWSCRSYMYVRSYHSEYSTTQMVDTRQTHRLMTMTSTHNSDTHSWHYTTRGTLREQHKSNQWQYMRHQDRMHYIMESKYRRHAHNTSHHN